MVRLKGEGVDDNYPYSIISIPYGAIKSRKALYSPIKISLFQFLMVRLKVDSELQGSG